MTTEMDTTPIITPTFPTIPSGSTNLGAVATTLEPFDGRENVKFYFEKLEWRSKLDNWTEEQTLVMFKYRLAGTGLQFYKSEYDLSSLGYKELKARFIKEFTIATIPGERLSRLNRAHQNHDETVAMYALRVKVLGAELLTERLENATTTAKEGVKSEIQQIILAQFKTGLRKEIAKDVAVACIGEKDPTLERLIEMAKMVELTLATLRGRSTAQEVMRAEAKSAPREQYNRGREPRLCYRCNRPGHFIRDCREPDPRRRGRDDRGARGYDRESYPRRREGQGGGDRRDSTRADQNRATPPQRQGRSPSADRSEISLVDEHLNE